MIVGIGVDVCAVPRMERELAREGGGFRDHVFTPNEIADCEQRHRPARHYAARFAAKEAVWKAIGTGAPDTGGFREAEVCAAEDGARRLVLHGRLRAAAERRGVDRIALAFTHSHEHAIASVVLEAADAARMEVARAEL